jgi:hypothetical protein
MLKKNIYFRKLYYAIRFFVKDNIVDVIKAIIFRFYSRQWPEKSIVYYTGKTYEIWSPKSLSRGLGGSQTAVIYLSRQWILLGYKVIVYGNFIDEGIYDGVQYLHYQKFNPFDVFEILIIWRDKNISVLNLLLQAREIWLDLHDVPYHPEQFTPELLNKLTFICVKSHYQRSYLQHVQDFKFKLIPNGIDAGALNLLNVLREPYRLVYSSRYYRGLELMLRFGWPIIRRHFPDAEFHLYGGWSEPDNSPHRAQWKLEMIDLMNQPGVFHQGRVGQDQLLQDKARSAIHYYACTFEEIDCISVRESAAVGCVPVTSDYAVFTEKAYCLKVPGDPLRQSVQEAIAYQVVDLLQNPERLARFREEFRERVLSETWDKIAPQWVQ